MEWTTENNKLSKEFIFKNFKEALRFVNQVGELAEEMDHHPDLLIHSYKKVLITLTTHSKGKVTERDHQLASKIDSI